MSNPMIEAVNPQGEGDRFGKALTPRKDEDQQPNNKRKMKMKKTKLKDCPQWLLEASTLNEDVDFDEYGTLVWNGGYFLGGYFRGEKITSAPLFIFNIGQWIASITALKMAIGCQTHSHDSWRNFTEHEISKMSEKATEFWAKNKTMLLNLCDYKSKC